jgi:hypothetical protein
MLLVKPAALLMKKSVNTQRHMPLQASGTVVASAHIVQDDVLKTFNVQRWIATVEAFTRKDLSLAKQTGGDVSHVGLF